MLVFSRLDWRVRKVATDLAHVLEDRDPVLPHVVPETAGAELAAHDGRAAGGDRRRVERHQRRAVEKRQHAVEDVIRPELGRRLPAGADAEEASMTDARGLRQPRGAGGEDEEARIFRADVLPTAGRID